MNARLPSPRSTKRSRGYTAVEVLMGLTLLSIGAAAVITMQRGAIQANLDARKMDMANAIAREWIERLRRDATRWTLPSAQNPGGNNYGNALLLSSYLQWNNTNVNSAWSYPDALLSGSVPDGVSPGFDILGRDLVAADIKYDSTNPTKLSSAQFCVNIRLNWLVVNQLIRAEVRVFWPRARSYPDDQAVTPNYVGTDWCSAANTSNVTGNTTDYHFVYAATAIRQNPVQ